MAKLFIVTIALFLFALNPTYGGNLDRIVKSMIKNVVEAEPPKMGPREYCSLDFDGENYVDSILQVIATKLKDKYDPLYTVMDEEIIKAIKIYGLSTLQRLGRVEKLCQDGQLVLMSELTVPILQAYLTIQYHLLANYTVHGHLIVNIINPTFGIIFKYSPELGKFTEIEGESLNEGVVDNLEFKETYSNVFEGKFKKFLNVLMEGGPAAFRNIAFMRVPLIVDEVINGTYPLPHPEP